MDVDRIQEKQTRALSRLEWLLQLCGSLLFLYLTLFAIAA